MENIYQNKAPKKTLVLLCIFCALLALSFFACKKSPTDGVKLIISTNIIKYTAFVQLQDAANTTVIPPNATIRISGQDASYVYEISGKKKFTLTNGRIDIGLNPVKVPTSTAPTKFNVEVSAPGYLPISHEVVMQAGQLQQNVKIQLLNLTTPPTGVRVTSLQLPMTANGAVSATSVLKVGVGKVVTSIAPVRQTQAIGTQSISANGTYYDDALTSLVVGQGATFHYYTQADGTPAGTDYTPILNTPADGYVAQTLLAYRMQGYYDYENTQYSNKVVTQTAYNGPVTAVITYPPTVVLKPFAFIPLNSNPATVYYINGYDNVVKVGLPVPTTGPEDELIFQSAVLKPITSVTFFGQLSDGSSIELKPDATSPWYVSMACDPNAVNPNNGKALKSETARYLEYGIQSTPNNPEFNNYTLSTSAVPADNGEYRVQIQATDAGFYYHATNIYNIDYHYTTHLDTSLVPDAENLYAIGGVGAYDPTTNQSISYTRLIQPTTSDYNANITDVNFMGKLVSGHPLFVSYFFNFYYWGKPINVGAGYASNNPYFYPGSLYGIGGIGQGFAPTSLWNFIDKSKLGKETAFDISVTCASNTNITIKPYVEGVLTGDDGSYGIFSVNDGVWTTRGLTPGATYSLSAQAGSTNLGFSQKATPGVYYYQKTLVGGDLCNNY